jgi:hypothetical protein
MTSGLVALFFNMASALGWSLPQPRGEWNTGDVSLIRSYGNVNPSERIPLKAVQAPKHETIRSTPKHKSR